MTVCPGVGLGGLQRFLLRWDRNYRNNPTVAVKRNAPFHPKLALNMASSGPDPCKPPVLNMLIFNLQIVWVDEMTPTQERIQSVFRIK